MDRMENNEQFKIILLKYIVNEADPFEREMVEQWLGKSEENKEEYRSMASLWQLTAAVNSAQNMDAVKEWKSFKSKHLKQPADLFLHEADVPSPAPEISATSRKPLVLKLVIASTVAASVLLLIVLSKHWFTDDVNLSVPAIVTSSKPDSVYNHVKKIVNNTAATRMVYLQDGSSVELYSKSELVYTDPFDKDKREVRLTGKGLFRVSADKTRPFTVFTKDLATTVLGTRFTVTDYAGEEVASVKLFEGQVLIRSAAQQKAFTRDYYLLPGDQFIYNKLTSEAKLIQQTSSRTGITTVPDNGSGTDSPLFPQHKKGQWYMFNNQPLSQVFAQLSALYGVEIVYTSKDVENVYFIGEFDRKDSLQDILREIATPNGFKITKDGNKFVVTK